MFRRKKSVNKKKLEHKLYLARETPELVFDLSDCDLIQVPSGIYSLCKVFRKNSLRLQNNQLNSLSGGGDLKDLCNLIVLDICSNFFTSLPDDISLLTNLQELYLQNNQFKYLPITLCNLVNLKILDVSTNRLKYLPENIGNLINLQKLKITNNPDLKSLPKNICMAQEIISLELDSEQFVYPPSEVAKRGTKEIMRYICSDVNFEYISPSQVKDVKTEDKNETVDEIDTFQEKIWNLEKIKLRRMQEFLEIERNNEFLQQQEIELAISHKVNRDKLLASIAEQQNKFDTKLIEIHHERECERLRLIEQLQEAENNADIAINKLLAVNKEPTAQLLEHELEEEQKLLAAVNKYNETLRKDDILTAMQDILIQETEVFKKFDDDRVETSRNILEQELEIHSKLISILQNQDMQKANLVVQLLEDSNLQKTAVCTLLERGDARSWGLLQQVRLVEAQLLALTNIELDRKRLKMDEHLNNLSEKRINLSVLLLDLLDQQKERRAQLFSTLQSMEKCKDEQVEDFWLKQYQNLLEKLPDGLSQAQKNIDQKLAEILLAKGVLHCLPFLAKLTQCQSNTKSITDQLLVEAGIVSVSDRLKILDALHIYSKETITSDFTPSAPLLQNEASAPPLDDIKTISSVECVICMELECHIIFAPCGHLCCCCNCSLLIAECPLCRTIIKRKITMVPLST